MRTNKGLDDPEYAAFAWARFRKILWWMGGAALIAVGLAELWLWWAMGDALDLFTIVAVAIGFFVTIMVTAVLMGLIFLSSGSGHDEQVDHRDD